MAATVHALPLSVSAPKQARSERTLYRILDAAEALIAERGLSGLSIPEVTRRAGSSVGGFYARLRDKNELLYALEERFFQEVSLRLAAIADEERWRTSTVEEIVAAAVDELVTVTEARGELMRAFLFRATQDSKIRDRALEFRLLVSERMSRLLLAKHPDAHHPDPAVAIDLSVQAAFALMQQHVLFDGTHAAGRKLSGTELRHEIARLVLSYVGFTTTLAHERRIRRPGRERARHERNESRRP